MSIWSNTRLSQLRDRQCRWFMTVFAFTVSLALMPAAARAQSQDEVIAELQAQLAALTERLSTLEARRVPEQSYETPTVVAPSSRVPGWYDRIKMKGDFRFRQEHVDAENSSNRNRQRIRARAELTAEVLDTVDVGLGFASGGDDPVSTNQTLGDGGSTKDIRLDLAYVNWQTPIDGLSVRAGKYKNTMRRVGGNGLVWDSDLRPEGTAAVFKTGNWFGTGFALWVDENSGDDDTLYWGGQAGWQSDINNMNLLLGAGYTRFEISGDEVVFDGDPRGNSVDPTSGTYLYDYEDLELFAELRLDVFAGYPPCSSSTTSRISMPMTSTPATRSAPACRLKTTTIPGSWPTPIRISKRTRLLRCLPIPTSSAAGLTVKVTSSAASTL